jgi:hypothetical protein
VRAGAVVRVLAVCGALVAVAAAPAGAVVPGVNGPIVYERLNIQIDTVNPDGSGNVELTELGHNFDPAWSPDSRMIAFVSDRQGASFEDLFVMDAGGLGQRPISRGMRVQDPVWSPDGRRLAFNGQPSQSPAVPSQLYVINVDGSGLRQITNEPMGAEGPSWSPDGTRIAYTRFGSGPGSSEIVVIDPQGGSPVQVTNNSVDDAAPSWSPDGSQLAFARCERFNVGTPNEFCQREIVVMNADGSAARRVTNPSEDNAPAWSPDGTQIVFQHTPPTGNVDPELYIVNSDGAGLRQLTSFNGNGAVNADWGRPPPGPLPPVRGVSVDVFVDRGTVLVKLPRGTAARGVVGAATSGFVPLSKLGGQIPTGSTLDTTHGQVRLVAATTARGGRQTGHFSQGLFIVQQTHTNPLTTLTMTGGDLRACGSKLPTGGAARRAVTARARRRSLFSNVRGRFRTRGRYSAATVRGTAYLVKDTCAGTLTSVSRGAVTVRDLTLRKNVTVRAHHRYLARPPR